MKTFLRKAIKYYLLTKTLAMKTSPLLLVLSCLVCGIVTAQDWVTFTRSTPQPPVISLTQSGNQQVQYSVEVCGMYKTDLTAEGENFQRIEIPGAGRTSQTGEPELPYIRQMIAIPECDSVILIVTVTSQTDFSNYNIYPAPDYEEVEGPDSSVYLQEVFLKMIRFIHRTYTCLIQMPR